MLDADTKNRIDSARDILVGKVPDPKSQVEQITIALIYKFMDDMDRQSEELGGKATFFSDGFKKYAWAKLIDKRLSGHERLILYAEGIEKMNENKNIPQLFRDIFRGVFLPYRDPETLNLFLKEINGFSYDHSERLGDAFEYLLSVMDSQGAAGQFRTPRHIIDFIVAVVDPQKNETILDPACGTAGFLISSYKHILNCGSQIADCGLEDRRPSIPKSKIQNPLTPDERARLMTNFCGYDISPDMVRLSRVNLYLHSFVQPRIHEYDTLTSEERWDERFDVIMANPPFMTPKGGIRPHKRFSITANRSEVLFVDYIAEHLNPGGRAGIIVPEGIIFQSQNAYKKLRRMLVENLLWAVVSLPAGIFNPYAGVKTSILLLDRNLAKRTDEVLFVKVQNDGFDLGAQRRPNGKNDLPEALKILAGHIKGQKPKEGEMAILVTRKCLLDNVDCNLSGDRYRDSDFHFNAKWPMVKFGDDRYFRIESGGTPASGNPEFWDGDIPWVTLIDLPQTELITDLLDTQRKITEKGLKNSSAVLLSRGSILVSSRATIGRVAITKIPATTNQGFKNIVIKDFTKVNKHYVAYVVTQLVPRMFQMASGGTFKEISKTNFSNLEIPIPPLAEQERIVAELEGYRKVIEGARKILAFYKPTIRIDPAWPIRKLGEIIAGKPKNGYSGKPIDYPTKVRVLSLSATTSGRLELSHFKYLDEEIEQTSFARCRKGDIFLQRGNTAELVGTAALFDVDDQDYVYPDLMIRVRANDSIVLSSYLVAALQSPDVRTFVKNNASGSAGSMPKINQTIVESIPIPLPPLNIQRQIVAELEAERRLVEANRELIARMEEKIKTKLADVWGETTQAEGEARP